METSLLFFPLFFFLPLFNGVLCNSLQGLVSFLPFSSFFLSFFLSFLLLSVFSFYFSFLQVCCLFRSCFYLFVSCSFSWLSRFVFESMKNSASEFWNTSSDQYKRFNSQWMNEQQILWFIESFFLSFEHYLLIIFIYLFIKSLIYLFNLSICICLFI